MEPFPSWSCSQAVSKPVWYTPLLCVQWKTPDGGQRNCPKHVEFYSKNKFEKLVHLVGFIIRIYHDARSSECQVLITFFLFVYFLTWLRPLAEVVGEPVCLHHRPFDKWPTFSHRPEFLKYGVHVIRPSWPNTCHCISKHGYTLIS